MKELIQAGYGYALSLTHAPADAEDLVHDAWLRLARNGQQRPNRALLFTVIRNLHTDAWRRRQRFTHEPLDDESLAAPTVDEDLQLDRVDLDTALARLRPEEREAIYLQAVQGFTAAQTAELMDRPRGSILSLIHRGKQKLRHLLQTTDPQESP